MIEPPSASDEVGRHAPPPGVEEEVVGRREDPADGDVGPGSRVLVCVDRVEALDRHPVRLRMGAEEDLDHPAARVEDDVHRALEAAHRRHLVDVRAHRPGVRAVVRLWRRHERAVIRLDRLVGDDAGQDQLAAPAGAPVVRLGLADRDLQVARGDLLVQPDGRAAGRDADIGVQVRVTRVVLVEGDAEALHPREVLPAELLLDVRVRHREDLAVGADDDRRLAGGLERVENGGEELRLRGGAELVVDDHGHARRSRDQLREAGSGHRGLERGPGRLGRVRDGLGLVRVDGSQQVPSGDLELERLTRDLALVVRRPDRQRVERLVGDDGGVRVWHGRLPVSATSR